MRVTIDGTPCSPSQSSHSLVEDLPLTTERSCSVQYYVGWSSLKKMYVINTLWNMVLLMSCCKGLARWVWVCQVCQLVNIPIWSPSSQHTTLMLLDVIGICCMLSSTYNNKMPCFLGASFCLEYPWPQPRWCLASVGMHTALPGGPGGFTALFLSRMGFMAHQKMGEMNYMMIYDIW